MKIFIAFFLIGCTTVSAGITLTVDRVTYSNVVFGASTPHTGKISFDGGLATLPIAKLPQEYWKQLGYDPAKDVAPPPPKPVVYHGNDLLTGRDLEAYKLALKAIPGIFHGAVAWKDEPIVKNLKLSSLGNYRFRFTGIASGMSTRVVQSGENEIEVGVPFENKRAQIVEVTQSGGQLEILPQCSQTW